jgi:hypothetical protein
VQKCCGAAVKMSKCCSRDRRCPGNIEDVFVAATGGRGGFRHHPIGAAPVSATEGRCGKHRQRLVYPPSFWRARLRRACPQWFILWRAVSGLFGLAEAALRAAYILSKFLLKAYICELRIVLRCCSSRHRRVNNVLQCYGSRCYHFIVL